MRTRQTAFRRTILPRRAPAPVRSDFFAYLSRMKHVRRWSLMQSPYPENLQEHCLRVAQIAHMLAVIRNRLFHGNVDENRVVALAIFHDACEVLTGDTPTPVKNLNPRIRQAHAEAEGAAADKLLNTIPQRLRGHYASLLMHRNADREEWQIVGAADKISAYIKCVEETSAGNPQFAKAQEAIKKTLDGKLPEVRYFMRTFVRSIGLTLDELN